MKKLFVLVLTLMMAMALCSCGDKKDNGPEPGTPVDNFYQGILNAQPEGVEDLILFEEFNPEMIESFYTGLSDIELSQQAFYMPPIVTHPCEIALVEVKNSADIEKVVDIFKARIALGADNTTYPESAAGWKLYAQVQQSGNFVCMIVLPEGYVIPENVFVVSADKVPETTAPETNAPETEAQTEAQTEQEAVVEDGVMISPLPDATMEDLSDAIVAASFEEGDIYVGEDGTLEICVNLYTNSMYDAAQLSAIKVGDTLVTNDGEVKVTSVDRNDDSAYCINGGAAEGGIDLAPIGGGVFLHVDSDGNEVLFLIGEYTFPASEDLKEFNDYADITPYNTMVRFENTQAVEIIRN